MQVLGLIVWMFQYMDAENESFTEIEEYINYNKTKRKNQ